MCSVSLKNLGKLSEWSAEEDAADLKTTTAEQYLKVMSLEDLTQNHREAVGALLFPEPIRNGLKAKTRV